MKMFADSRCLNLVAHVQKSEMPQMMAISWYLNVENQSLDLVDYPGIHRFGEIDVEPMWSTPLTSQVTGMLSWGGAERPTGDEDSVMYWCV